MLRKIFTIIVLNLVPFLSVLAQGQMDTLSIKYLPNKTKIILNKELKIYPNILTQSIFFIDEHLTYAEITIEGVDEMLILPPGTEFEVYSKEENMDKSYEAYKTRERIFCYLKGHNYVYFHFFMDDKTMTLADLNNSPNTSNYFTIVLPQEAPIKEKK